MFDHEVFIELFWYINIYIYVCLQLLILVIESTKEQTAEALSTLLKNLYDACYLTTDQLTQGFVRVLDNIQDIQLDVPKAYETFD